jgi:ribosome-binding factor A
MTRRRAWAPSQRQLRVGEEIRHALSRIFMRGELHEPALGGADITVSEVRVSPDLKAATVFVLPLGGTNTADVMAGLRRAAPAVRARLAREVELRFLPRLQFEADQSFDAASRIDALLHDPAVARDLAQPESVKPEDDDDA